VARALALLISDEFDPERLTIQSVMALQDTRTVLEGSMAIELVSRLLSDPQLTDRVHDLALFAAHDDGIDYTLDSLLYMAERNLGDVSDEESMCSGLTIGSLEETLLTQSGFVFGPGTGEAAWVPRVDVHGNPRVRELGGALLGPFVDTNNDGAADVNADGVPVDAGGAEIDLPALGTADAAGRDAYGRAIDADGELIYEYYDAKRTGLAAAVQIVRGLLEGRSAPRPERRGGCRAGCAGGLRRRHRDVPRVPLGGQPAGGTSPSWSRTSPRWTAPRRSWTRWPCWSRTTPCWPRTCWCPWAT
jgi:hypothetical protein